MFYRSIHHISGPSVIALATFFMSCSDPVRQKQIDALGPEAGDVPAGELHRPGQPCVLCHSDGGPANTQFAIGGTIFETSAPDAPGASGVRVFFIDASSAQRDTQTNDAGNFFIPVSDWPDLTFPFKVGILKDKPVTMKSTVNREGSCNFCHRPTPGSKISLPTDDPRSSIGQIYVTAGGT